MTQHALGSDRKPSRRSDAQRLKRRGAGKRQHSGVRVVYTGLSLSLEGEGEEEEEAQKKMEVIVSSPWKKKKTGERTKEGGKRGKKDVTCIYKNVHSTDKLWVGDEARRTLWSKPQGSNHFSAGVSLSKKTF